MGEFEIWPFLYPTNTDRCLTAARELGIPTDINYRGADSRQTISCDRFDDVLRILERAIDTLRDEGDGTSELEELEELLAMRRAMQDLGGPP
ncbi:MAG: hypothetical protein AB7U73_10650 [Pirellulales bacterium]